MPSETVTVVNAKGLHARASAKFVGAVTQLADGLDVQVTKDGTSAGGSSILGLMMLGAARGDTIEIAVEGENADAALAKLVGLVKDGFGED
ncbi:HPr family phosphocarrier protein [Pseudoblastomonas halimionae]|uniref:HPr family phosphocarrier protein n=1 Tax=Alteriqipengyuania halimionae TaxID=1926630 RepID=A0A6I4U1J1_9SPHN|nr:HPr family phosphocarrier protein [Alteriqipengyuania halimionae]MXP09949.1 HPr family phosphocarrier protein [Alteriqipengyuania halimionae]